jgi:Ca2+/H+ antiporter
VSRFVKGTPIEKPPNIDGEGIGAMLWHPLCVFLVCIPVGFASPHLGWSAPTTFFLNFLALIPLAKILGDATEELAAGLHNDMLAGLLNATFGNAVEVVMMVQTLRAGLICGKGNTLGLGAFEPASCVRMLLLLWRHHEQHHLQASGRAHKVVVRQAIHG